MITFKCDKCGYTFEIPADQMTCERSSSYDEDKVNYYISVVKPERTFRDFKSNDRTWLLCNECHKNWVAVVQDIVNKAALDYVEGGGNNG